MIKLEDEAHYLTSVFCYLPAERWPLAAGFRHPQPATSSVESRAALLSDFPLTSVLCLLLSVFCVLTPET
jgi:hypothetical protein